MQAASPLLLLAGQLRGTLSRRWTSPASGVTRSTRSAGSRSARAPRASRTRSSWRRATRLCAALDEAVLSTPWGAQSEWAQQTLLVALHREAWGGEKFFEMLDRISQDPGAPHRPDGAAVSLPRVRLRGKYQVLDRGHEQLADVQQDLYRKIRNHRGAPPPELSLRWRGLEDRRNPLIRYVPWWVVGAAALAVLAVAFTVYYAQPRRASRRRCTPQLAKIGLEEFAQPGRRRSRGPDAQAAAGAGRSARRAERRRGGRPHA